MNRWIFGASISFLLAVASFRILVLGGDPSDSAVLAPAGPRIEEAATAFLGALRVEQRERALFEFASKERFDWHFIPRARKGIALEDLDGAQRKLVLALLDAALGETGGRRARQVMALEDVLREIEGPTGSIARNPLAYWIAVFGRPSREGRWGFRFEGHHLSVNFTLDGTKVLSATPNFYGANPAIVREGPDKGLRILAGVEDTARKLVESLDPAQLAACRDEEGVPSEVPETQKARYAGPLPAGISASRLTKAQAETLRDLVGEYLSNFTKDYAAEIEALIWKEDPSEVHFAWRGATKPFEPHSYLLHGKTFVINYSNVQNGGAHVHSVIRLREGDFGPGATD